MHHHQVVMWVFLLLRVISKSIKWPIIPLCSLVNLGTLILMFSKYSHSALLVMVVAQSVCCAVWLVGGLASLCDAAACFSSPPFGSGHRNKGFQMSLLCARMYLEGNCIALFKAICVCLVSNSIQSFGRIIKQWFYRYIGVGQSLAFIKKAISHFQLSYCSIIHHSHTVSILHHSQLSYCFSLLNDNIMLSLLVIMYPYITYICRKWNYCTSQNVYSEIPKPYYLVQNWFWT